MPESNPVYLLDANILLRFLMDDEPKHSAATQRLFDEARSGRISLRIPFIAISETIFTLQSHYKIGRSDIGRELLKLLNTRGVTLTCPLWILDAIEDFRISNVAFGDACLAAEARSDDLPIASFDRGLSKFAGVIRHDPSKPE